jgi:alpha-galactosidase
VNRRHFIQSSGLSLGALLVVPAVGTLCSCSTRGTPGTPAPTLAIPEVVQVRTEEGLLTLVPSRASTWTCDTVEVTVRPAGAVLQVWVESPTARVKAVTLVWRRSTQPSTLYLGDAWERAYGDLAWKKADPARVMPWYVMEFDGSVTHGAGVKTGCASLASWRMGAETLDLVLDVRSGGRGVRLGQRRLLAAEIVVHRGKTGETPFQATRELCRKMCDKPLLPREPMVGMLDWYFTYGKCTDRLFVEESELFAKLVEGCGVKAFALVDAGWAPGDRSCWHDDQTVSHPDFGSIEKLPQKVRALGLVPGIWTRVLCTQSRDPESLRLPRDRRYLDPSLPENLARIRSLMQLFRAWGFGVIKHDYTTYDIFGRWGFEMGSEMTNDGWTFHDDTRTTAEIILGLYRAIREGCGPDASIIGCNTVSHLSAGLVEYCRVGDDSGNNLERAMKFGCNPFAFRLPQHNTFYAADPDCVGNLKEIPWKYNRQFIQLVAESGALLQISARLGGITMEQRDAIRAGCRRIGERSPRHLEPLDWTEHHIPARWKIGNRVVDLDWDLTSA